MTCIKTGADVFLPEHGCTVHGDLYEVADMYILCCGDHYDACCDYTNTKANITFGWYEICGSRVIVSPRTTADGFTYESEQKE